MREGDWRRREDKGTEGKRTEWNGRGGKGSGGEEAIREGSGGEETGEGKVGGGGGGTKLTGSVSMDPGSSTRAVASKAGSEHAGTWAVLSRCPQTSAWSCSFVPGGASFATKGVNARPPLIWTERYLRFLRRGV